MHILKKFLSNESGATALEYSLIIAATSAVVLVALEQIGVSLGVIITTIATTMQSFTTS